MKDINIKFEKSKIDEFRLLIETIIKGGLDLWLTNRQTEARIYFKESGKDIVLKIDGTWEIE